MVPPASRLNRRDWLVLCAIAAVGLALRIAAARGGLWLDEVWSSIMAHEAGTPAGVFLSINHDNNHHLNTLWLQAIGYGAPPLLARALSIVSSTIAILVAARIGAAHSRAAGWLTALGFALSPVMVTLGSEARGYAPMSLALLSAILLVGNALRDGNRRGRTRAIALASGLGMLAQLTMVYGFFAILGWVFVECTRRAGWRAALGQTWELLGASLIATIGVVAFVLAAAHFSGTGFRFGEYLPFDAMRYVRALATLLGTTIGGPATLWLLPLAVIVALLAPLGRGPRVPFYLLALIAFPLAIAALRLANPGHPRYYLLVAIALLLLLPELIANALRRGTGPRIVASLAVAVFAIASAADDAELIRSQRGDPQVALRYLAPRAPHGITLMTDRESATVILRYAATRDRYPIAFQPLRCPAQRYALLDRWPGETFPGRLRVCGAWYRPVAQRLTHGLSGAHWTIYARQP